MHAHTHTHMHTQSPVTVFEMYPSIGTFLLHFSNRNSRVLAGEIVAQSQTIYPPP